MRDNTRPMAIRKIYLPMASYKVIKKTTFIEKFTYVTLLLAGWSYCAYVFAQTPLEKMFYV